MQKGNEKETGSYSCQSYDVTIKGEHFTRRTLKKTTYTFSIPRRSEAERILKEDLIKIGAKMIEHLKYVIFYMAEVAVPKDLFCEILERISRLTLVALTPGTG